MVKVTLPLGSAAAHGQVGSSIIFQGTTAKAFKKPRNPRTIAQDNQRALFRDITMMARTFGAWPRAALRGAFGKSWWGEVFKLTLASWGAAAAEFDAWTFGDQLAWREAAPYKITIGDCGLTYYAVAKAIYNKLILLDNGIFELIEPTSENSGEVATWTARDLAGVFVPGAYDDDHVNFLYSGPGHWDFHIPEEVEPFVFFGSSYAWTVSGDSPSVEFYFVGNQIEVYYFRALGYGTMQIQIDQTAPVTVSQSDLPYGMLVSWASGIIEQGLHHVRISQVGTTAPIYFDGVIVSGV